MNLIGCLVYGVYDLENFVSPGLGYTKILIKKKKSVTERVECFCKCNCKQLILGFMYKGDISIFSSQQSQWLIMAGLPAF